MIWHRQPAVNDNSKVASWVVNPDGWRQHLYFVDIEFVNGVSRAQPEHDLTELLLPADIVRKQDFKHKQTHRAVRMLASTVRRS